MNAAVQTAVAAAVKQTVVPAQVAAPAAVAAVALRGSKSATLLEPLSISQTILRAYDDAASEWGQTGRRMAEALVRVFRDAPQQAVKDALKPEAVAALGFTRNAKEPSARTSYQRLSEARTIFAWYLTADATAVEKFLAPSSGSWKSRYEFVLAYRRDLRAAIEVETVKAQARAQSKALGLDAKATRARVTEAVAAIAANDKAEAVKAETPSAIARKISKSLARFAKAGNKATGRKPMSEAEARDFFSAVLKSLTANGDAQIVAAYADK